MDAWRKILPSDGTLVIHNPIKPYGAIPPSDEIDGIDGVALHEADLWVIPMVMERHLGW